MAQFLLKRLFQVMLVMFIISAFCFGIQDSLGDPTRELAAMSMSDEERENLRDTLGLNDPLLVQYGRFVGQLLFFQRTGTHRNIEKIARHT
jgi:peptide/nickel transport system permease protein